MAKLTEQHLLDNDYQATSELNNSFYILADGTFWDAEVYDGDRTLDHRAAEIFTKYDRYDGSIFWEEVMVDLELIMVVRESEQIFIHPNHKPTPEQQTILEGAKKSGWEVKEFS